MKIIFKDNNSNQHYIEDVRDGTFFVISDRRNELCIKLNGLRFKNLSSESYGGCFPKTQIICVDVDITVTSK